MTPAAFISYLEQQLKSQAQKTDANIMHLIDNPDFKAYRHNQLIPLQSSAVLIPVVWIEDKAHLLLTKRAEHLRHHPGDIAFPGGKPEADDPSLEETALRECEEELGIARSQMHIIGQLNDYISLSGFWIQPYIAWIDAFDTLSTLSPNPTEVTRVFMPEFSHLMDPRRFSLHQAQHQHHIRHFYQVRVEDDICWGATAGILYHLAQLCSA